MSAMVKNSEFESVDGTLAALLVRIARNSGLSKEALLQKLGTPAKECVCAVCGTRHFASEPCPSCEKARENARRRKERLALDRYAGVPLAHRSANLESVGDIFFRRWVTTLLDDFEHNRMHGAILCLVHGGFGVGKSYMGAAAVHAFLAKGKTARYTDAVRIGAMVRYAGFGKEYADPESVYDELSSYDLLVIDEVGTPESLRESYQSAWERAILLRYEACLPTVVITNMTEASFAQTIDERIVDRVMGTKGVICHVEGPSRRRTEEA